MKIGWAIGPVSFDVYKQTQQDTRLAKQDSTVKSIVKKLKRDCGYESRKMGTNINPCSMVGFMTTGSSLVTQIGKSTRYNNPPKNSGRTSRKFKFKGVGVLYKTLHISLHMHMHALQLQTNYSWLASCNGLTLTKDDGGCMCNAFYAICVL